MRIIIRDFFCDEFYLMKLAVLYFRNSLLTQICRFSWILYMINKKLFFFVLIAKIFEFVAKKEFYLLKNIIFCVIQAKSVWRGIFLISFNTVELILSILPWIFTVNIMKARFWESLSIAFLVTQIENSCLLICCQFPSISACYFWNVSVVLKALISQTHERNFRSSE